ncbi:MAG: hypothetical protein HOV87_11880 [Catenulispora sp.]|nr:hypothetical protein [Catenulispora sp.]NUT43922.1 hypothetical protein [Thermoactinospora sp.]
MWTDLDLPGEPVIEVYAECGRHGGLMMMGHPDAIPTVWVDQQTMSPLRPDGTPIKPGQPGTVKLPLCHPCADFLTRFPEGGPLFTLFPRANRDAFNLTEPTP